MKLINIRYTYTLLCRYFVADHQILFYVKFKIAIRHFLLSFRRCSRFWYALVSKNLGKGWKSSHLLPETATKDTLQCENPQRRRFFFTYTRNKVANHMFLCNIAELGFFLRKFLGLWGSACLIYNLHFAGSHAASKYSHTLLFHSI